MSSLYGATGSGNKVPSGFQRASLSNYNPDQMKLFKSLFSHLSPDSYLSRLAGGDEDLFNEMEEPALRQFSGIQGNLASRFSGMGLGGRHSSGFQNASTTAASDFAGDLQSRRQDLQRQALKDLMSMSNELLGQRTHDNFLVADKPGFLQSLLGNVGRGAVGFGSMLGTGNLYKKFLG